MVDEILRVKIGDDYGTGSGIQGHFHHLLDTWEGGLQSKSLKADHRML